MSWKALDILNKVTSRLVPGWWGNAYRQRNLDQTYDHGYLPASKVNYDRAAGPLHLNAVVSAALGWLTDEAAKAVFQVEETKADGIVEPKYNHALTLSLETPNPFDTFEDLMTATYRDYVIDGNGYWLPIGSRGGGIAEYWHVPAWRVEPQWDQGGSEWIGWYRINLDRTWVKVKPEALVHFKDGKDPYNERKGLSRLKAGLRLVASLNECETLTHSLLKSPVPGVIVSRPTSKEGGLRDELGKRNAQRLKRMVEAACSQDNRFRAVVLDTDVEVNTVGFSPEQMRLERLPLIPEATLCALIGVSPIVLALPSGAEYATDANGAQAARNSWSRLQAIQRRLAQTITRGLLRPHFEPSGRFRCGWDYSTVDALAEDKKSVAERVAIMFGSATAPGAILRNEGRELLGLDPLPPEFGDVLADGYGPGNPKPEPEPMMMGPDGKPKPIPPNGDGADEDKEENPFAKALTNGHARHLWTY